MIVFAILTFDGKYFSFDLKHVALKSSKMMMDNVKMSRNGRNCILTYHSFFPKMIYEKLKDQENNL